ARAPLQDRTGYGHSRDFLIEEARDRDRLQSRAARLPPPQLPQATGLGPRLPGAPRGTGLVAVGAPRLLCSLRCSPSRIITWSGEEIGLGSHYFFETSTGASGGLTPDQGPGSGDRLRVGPILNGVGIPGLWWISASSGSTGNDGSIIQRACQKKT